MPAQVTYLEATDPLRRLGDALCDRVPHRDDLVVIAGCEGVWQVQRCKHHPPTWRKGEPCDVVEVMVRAAPDWGAYEPRRKA